MNDGTSSNSISRTVYLRKLKDDIQVQFVMCTKLDVTMNGLMTRGKPLCLKYLNYNLLTMYLTSLKQIVSTMIKKVLDTSR